MNKSAMFKHKVNLMDSTVSGAVIQDAWVSSLTVTLGHTRHSVTLTVLNLPAADLVSKGLFKKKSPCESITVPIEDEDWQSGFRRLKVNFNSTNTRAIDELTGEKYEHFHICNYSCLRASIGSSLAARLAGK